MESLDSCIALIVEYLMNAGNPQLITCRNKKVLKLTDSPDIFANNTLDNWMKHFSSSYQMKITNSTWFYNDTNQGERELSIFSYTKADLQDMEKHTKENPFQTYCFSKIKRKSATVWTESWREQIKIKGTLSQGWHKWSCC